MGITTTGPPPPSVVTTPWGSVCALSRYYSIVSMSFRLLDGRNNEGGFWFETRLPLPCDPPVSASRSMVLHLPSTGTL